MKASLFVISAAFAASTIAGEARATDTTIFNTFTATTVTSGGTNISASVAKFDPTLGTLSSIFLSYTITQFDTFIVRDFATSQLGSGFRAQYNVVALLSLGNVTVSQAFDRPFSTVPAPRERSVISTFSSSGGKSITSPSLSAFIATPDDNAYEFTVASLLPSFSFFQNGSQISERNQIVSASVSLAYTYYNTISTPDPASDVPEPATWAMLVLGFGAVGSVMRRKAATVRRPLAV